MIRKSNTSITSRKSRTCKKSCTTCITCITCNTFSLGFTLTTKWQRGFTLIEMLVYMGLLSIFLLVLTQVFTSSLDAQLESQATSTVEQDTRFIFTRLARDIENADNLVTPAAPGEESPSLVLTRSGETFTYSLQNSNLILADTLSINTLNSYATEVTALNFERLGNANGKNNIKVTFTIQSKTLRSGDTETKTFETTLGTR